MPKRKKYTKEFKEEAVKLVTEQGYTQAEAGKSLGIPDKNLSRWVREIKGLILKNSPPKAEDTELARLIKENKQLRLEREILKKAAAFFANEPQ